MSTREATLEYAPAQAAEVNLPAKWWLLGLAVTSAAAIWLPFTYNTTPAEAMATLISESLGLLPLTSEWGLLIYTPGIAFMLAPVLAYPVARLCLGGKLWRVERWAGYAVAALSVTAALLWDVRTVLDAVNPLGPRFVPDIWPSILAQGISWVLLLSAGWLGFSLRGPRHRGVGVCVLLMAAYVANACWAFLLAGDFGFDWGAILCAAICLWYLVTLAILFVRALRVGRERNVATT